MADNTVTREVNAKEALKCIRGSMSNGEVMAKFKITPAGYADLLRQLYAHNLITEEDLKRRGITFKSAKKTEESTEQVTHAPPPPVAEDDEFLDTVALTQLLTLKPMKNAGTRTKESNAAEADESQEDVEGKSKFRLRGIFKKDR
jgi:hypothetical protein